jgi:hypothetical protein
MRDSERHQARRGVWLIPGSLYELGEGDVYNTAPVINPAGHLVGNRSSLPEYLLPPFEVVGLSFRELYADQTARAFGDFPAPFDLAGEEELGSVVRDLDAELQRKAFRQLAVQLNPDPLERHVLGRAAHDRSRRQPVVGRRAELDDDSFVPPLAKVLTSVLYHDME